MLRLMLRFGILAKQEIRHDTELGEQLAAISLCRNSARARQDRELSIGNSRAYAPKRERTGLSGRRSCVLEQLALDKAVAVSDQRDKLVLNPEHPAGASIDHSAWRPGALYGLTRIVCSFGMHLHRFGTRSQWNCVPQR